MPYFARYKIDISQNPNGEHHSTLAQVIVTPGVFRQMFSGDYSAWCNDFLPNASRYYAQSELKMVMVRDKLLSELQQNGYHYKDVNRIFQQKELQSIEVEIILKWLRKLYDNENYGTADTLVRSLISAKYPFEPSLLIDLFENSDLNFYLKSDIGLVLAYAKTFDISEWLKDRLMNKPFAPENFPLIDGLIKKGGFAHIKDYMLFLQAIFDKYHSEAVLKSFDKYGDKEDMRFLESKLKDLEPKVAKTVNKIIKKHLNRH